jgi:GTP-binding protein Era
LEAQRGDAKKKAGFAVLIGRSNVGKSTLINALVGTKVAITSPKPQTTRQTIHGVLHDPRGQIVFVDTPGVFERAKDILTTHLNRTAKSALEGIDVIVYVVDPTREIGNEEKIVQRMISASSAPKILAINKIDLKGAPHLGRYRDLKDLYDETVEISARRAVNLVPLIDKIFELLPYGEPFYPEFQFSNMEHKTWLSELIREKVFIQTHSEIPFSANVIIDEEEDRDNGMLYIKARIQTTAPQYKKMIIGAGGRKIKEIGSAARKELQQILNKKIYLELEVEVEPRWQESL